MNKQKNNQTLILVSLAILIALSFILGQIKLFQLPAGGAITACSLLPIAFAGYLFGVKGGIVAGTAVGLLNLVFGGTVIHPVQMILDYPLGFAMMGLSGLTSQKKYGLLIGYIIGILGRYICSVISGTIFFAANTPEKFNAFTWSLWYNAINNFMEGGITIVIIVLFQKQFQNLRNKILQS